MAWTLPAKWPIGQSVLFYSRFPGECLRIPTAAGLNLHRFISQLGFRFNWGEVTLLEGFAIDVVSVRLLPPDTRFDLWTTDCWKQHTHSRRVRRAQLQELTSLLPPADRTQPMIVGGDFNAPAGDAIFRLFNGLLNECFREAGWGWGNTGINDLPIMRPDQVWVTQSSVTLKAWARKTIHSDHRMVICDLLVR